MLQNPVFNVYLMACGMVNIEIIGMQASPLAPDQTAHFFSSCQILVFGWRVNKITENSFH